MNFSTVPPWRSITALRRLEVAGERGAQALRVEPLAERGRAGHVALNSTVTVLRCSRGAESQRASGAPHASQNRAPSRFSAPHAGHVVTARGYGSSGGMESRPTSPGRGAPRAAPASARSPGRCPSARSAAARRSSAAAAPSTSPASSSTSARSDAGVAATEQHVRAVADGDGFARELLRRSVLRAMGEHERQRLAPQHLRGRVVARAGCIRRVAQRSASSSRPSRHSERASAASYVEAMPSAPRARASSTPAASQCAAAA